MEWLAAGATFWQPETGGNNSLQGLTAQYLVWYNSGHHN